MPASLIPTWRKLKLCSLPKQRRGEPLEARHSLQRILILAIAAIISATACSQAHDVRYWVWQRDDPLDEQELRELAAKKIDMIYWQAGELENIGATWRW